MQGVILVTDFRLTLEDGEGQTVSTVTLAQGETLPAPLIIDAGRRLKVSFKAHDGVDTFRPQQAFLQLESALGTAAFAAQGAKDGALSVLVTQAALVSRLPAGSAALSLVLGDAALPSGLTWSLGEVVVAATRGSAGLTARTQGPLPEIRHSHRLPEQRAKALSSLLGLLGVAGLGAAFVLALPMCLGGNLKGFPGTGRARSAALAFHAALCATAGTLALFWLRLTLLQTLPALGALALLVTQAGRALASSQGAEASPAKKGN